MAQQSNIAQEIGSAWAAHREGNQEQALKGFEQAISRQPDSVDAHYGMGLVLRKLNKDDAALQSFQKALELAQEALSALRRVAEAGGQAGTGNDLGSTEDDRYMMLIRMLKQRVVEMGGTV